MDAALVDPSLVFEAMTRRGVEAAEAAMTVTHLYHQVTGEFPRFGGG